MFARVAPPARLVAVADYGVLGERLPGAVALAAQGGIRWFLLRAKGLDPHRRMELTRRVLERAPEILLSVYGGDESAGVAGVGGVHFTSAAIAELGGAKGAIVGASCHDAEELANAKACGADYCFLSPVYGTISKESTAKPLGEARFGELAKSAGVPVFALGGVRPEKVAVLAGQGSYGAAVLGDLFLAGDTRARAMLWTETIERVYGK